MTKISELMQRRSKLLARIAAQREQMTEIGSQLRAPLALADQRRGCCAFLAFSILCWSPG